MYPKDKYFCAFRIVIAGSFCTKRKRLLGFERYKQIPNCGTARCGRKKVAAALI